MLTGCEGHWQTIFLEEGFEVGGGLLEGGSGGGPGGGGTNPWLVWL